MTDDHIIGRVHMPSSQFQGVSEDQALGSHKERQLTSCWGVSLVGYGVVNLRLFRVWCGFIHTMALLEEPVRRLRNVGRDRGCRRDFVLGFAGLCTSGWFNGFFS